MGDFVWLVGFSLFLVVLVSLTYFLPTTIAIARGYERKGAVFLVNLLVGWTVLGWVIALVWSLQENRRNREVVIVRERHAESLSEKPRRGRRSSLSLEDQAKALRRRR